MPDLTSFKQDLTTRLEARYVMKEWRSQIPNIVGLAAMAVEAECHRRDGVIADRTTMGFFDPLPEYRYEVRRREFTPQYGRNDATEYVAGERRGKAQKCKQECSLADAVLDFLKDVDHVLAVMHATGRSETITVWYKQRIQDDGNAGKP